MFRPILNSGRGNRLFRAGRPSAIPDRHVIFRVTALAHCFHSGGEAFGQFGLVIQAGVRKLSTIPTAYGEPCSDQAARRVFLPVRPAAVAGAEDHNAARFLGLAVIEHLKLAAGEIKWENFAAARKIAWKHEVEDELHQQGEEA